MGTSTAQPDSVMLTIGTNLLLLVAGCCARNSMPPLAVAHHLLAMAFSPVCSGGQFATACVCATAFGLCPELGRDCELQ